MTPEAMECDRLCFRSVWMRIAKSSWLWVQIQEAGDNLFTMTTDIHHIHKITTSGFTGLFSVSCILPSLEYCSMLPLAASILDKAVATIHLS